MARHAPLFGAVLAFSLVMSIFALSSSFYMLEVFDRVLTSRSLETLVLLTIIALAGLAVFGFLDAARRRLLIRIGLRVGESLSARVLAALVATNSQVGGGAFRSAMRDLDTVRSFIGSPTCATLFDVPFLLVYMVVLFFLSPWYVLVVAIGGGVLIGLAVIGHQTTNGHVTRAASLSLKAQSFAEDGARNADLLEGIGMSPTFVARWKRMWLDALRVNTIATDRESVVGVGSKTFRMVLQVALMATGAVLILTAHATGGVMIGATIIGSRAVQPIEMVVGSWKMLLSVRLASRRLRDLIRAAPRRDEGMALPAPEGRVKVSGAGYVVGSGRRAVLSNISFELAPGEFLGVVGPSASGKSTLGRLLVGAWPCTQGIVRLDGANIYAWPRAALGRHLGYLPQDIELFAGTVRDNIARMTEGDPEAVVDAARLAHAHELILGLPNGYDTEIGEGGHWLSGGQRQRVGLARALFGAPRYVVLDEPNSNLDGAGEQALGETLAELRRRAVTTIVIAHRPSVVAAMDKILVLGPGGTVAALGPAAEIISRFVPGADPSGGAARRGGARVLAEAPT